MNISQTYLNIISEDLEEGIIKQAIGATLIAGTSLLAYKAMHNAPSTPETPSRVSAGIVKKIGLTPMSQEEATKKIVEHWKVHPNTAHQITTAAWKYGNTPHVTPHVLLGLMATESSFDPSQTSKLKSDAAVGLMQVRPKMHGLKPKDLSSIDSQVKHGADLLKRFHNRMGNLSSGLTAYNNGVTATLMNKPSLNKTYAPKVLSNAEKFHK
jgi:hypothetical protein